MNEGPLDNLIRMLGGLPGLGNRSARRIALHLLNKRDNLMLPLAHSLQDAAQNVKECNICGNFDLNDLCAICRDAKRDQSKICVVTSVSDIWAIERTHAFKGLYHVLGGLLSALDGIGPEDLRLEQLTKRITDHKPEEVILALSATVDGQSTAHYINDYLSQYDLEITHLAHGVPMGGELDYLDDGTITTALKSRKAS